MESQQIRNGLKYFKNKFLLPLEEELWNNEKCFVKWRFEPEDYCVFVTENIANGIEVIKYFEYDEVEKRVISKNYKMRDGVYKFLKSIHVDFLTKEFDNLRIF